MKLSDKFEEIGCRNDDKARRVSNVAPNTAANITADALENGVSLEQLDRLNVPVLRYQTQLTIHGTLPAFNQSARPGGYKAVFLNKNKSVGVRYSAVDAEKKALIARACKATGKWSASNTSQAFTVGRCFYVKSDDNRDAVKQETIAAMRSIPVGRFYGSAYCFALAYGAGYGCAADIGAVPETELWPLINELTGLSDLAALEKAEADKQAEHDAKMAQWRSECEAKRAADVAAFELRWKAEFGHLAVLASPIESGEVVVKGESGANTYRLETERGWMFSTRIASTYLTDSDCKRKVCADGFPFKKALAAGRCYVTN